MRKQQGNRKKGYIYVDGSFAVDKEVFLWLVAVKDGEIIYKDKGKDLIRSYFIKCFRKFRARWQ